MVKIAITKAFICILLIFVGFGVLYSSSSSFAQEAEHEDKTLSPYFLVKSDDPSVDQMPLQSTSATVNIAGVIADVRVKQVYKNEGKSPLEAIYVFPGSTRAAVYGMKMTIGERTIVAKIEKREEARQQYEQAKQEGKSASLLEQKRPNVFQMNVANIMPGDIIEVELSYTELLVPTDSVYAFVYPTVVGPRYSSPGSAGVPPAQDTDGTSALLPPGSTGVSPAQDTDGTSALPENAGETPALPGEEQWVANPYLHEGEQPPYTFDIAINLSTGLPIQQATCTSHKVNLQYEGKSFATVKLEDSEKYGGNRDFILKYQLAGEQIESGLLLYEGEDENFFLLMVQPPKRVEKSDIPPREYIFIVDVSGSMRGFPLDISKTLLKNLIGNLQPHETFNVLLFASGSAVLSESGSLPATKDNIQKALYLLDRQRGGGGTEILPALKQALALPRTEGMSRTIVIATDGFVNVEPEAFDLIRNNLGNANMFAFGIGKSVNRFIIEGMAHVGMGEPFVITKPNEALAQAEKFREYIQSPVLTRIDLDFGKFDVHEVEPPGIPDVLAERPVICFGKWRGKPQGSIIVTGFTGDQPYKHRFDVDKVVPRKENASLRYLWARHRIKILGDYNMLRADDERVEVITELGLQYNLLTQYTSFVAIDTVVRRDKDGKLVTVKQPLPLPEGVSDLAVGDFAPQVQASRLMLSPGPPRAYRSGAKEEGPSGALKTDSAGATGKFFPPLATTTPLSEVKKVDSKTFSLINGIWVDNKHSEKKEIMKIRRDSQAYKDLIAAMPELKEYFEIGEKVIVNVGKYSIEIAEDGKTELTEEELKKLVG